MKEFLIDLIRSNLDPLRGLNEVKPSPQANEALSVKIEVDTHPPAGAGLETDLVRRYITLRLQHHDRASLLARKLRAILSRGYAKGRDLYDLKGWIGKLPWQMRVHSWRDPGRSIS